jgi:hypothetical protein
MQIHVQGGPNFIREATLILPKIGEIGGNPTDNRRFAP